jgi:hypothetical protein
MASGVRSAATLLDGAQYRFFVFMFVAKLSLILVAIGLMGIMLRRGLLLREMGTPADGADYRQTAAHDQGTNKAKPNSSGGLAISMPPT